MSVIIESTLFSLKNHWTVDVFGSIRLLLILSSVLPALVAVEPRSFSLILILSPVTLMLALGV